MCVQVIISNCQVEELYLFQFVFGVPKRHVLQVAELY